MTETLVNPVRRLEDRAELNELIHRYAMAVDDGDYDTLAELYAEEAEFGGRTDSPRGRTAIIDYLKSRQLVNGDTVHSPTSQVLYWDGPDSARGVVASNAQLNIDSNLVFLAFRYEDEYIRRDGRWQFLRRELTHLHQLPIH